MRLFAAAALAVLVIQTPDPDYIGPEDPTHAGQPRTCTNVPGRKAVKHDCPCHQSTCNPKAQMEDATCYVYCRKPACHCDHGCETD